VQRGRSRVVRAYHQRRLHADGARVRAFHAADLRRRLLHSRPARPAPRPQAREHSLRHRQQQRDQDHRLRTRQEVRPLQDFQGQLEVKQVI